MRRYGSFHFCYFVIASKAKQSLLRFIKDIAGDCFVACAPRNDRLSYSPVSDLYFFVSSSKCFFSSTARFSKSTFAWASSILFAALM